VRGEHDACPSLGHNLHQALQELAPGERVKAGHRLIEEDELGPFGDCHDEGELGALAAGERASPLTWVESKLRDPASGQLAVPARVEPVAHLEVPGDRQPRV